MIEFLDTSKKIEIPVYLFDALLGDSGSVGQKLDRKFDYVVGNPPWIRWGLLPNEYRDSTKVLWGKYGLFSLKGFEARMGGGEKDISALFVYVCSDKYLKNDGILGFVITQTIFLSKGAGEGFRNFKIYPETPFKIMQLDDFDAVQPFEGARQSPHHIQAKKE